MKHGMVDRFFVFGGFLLLMFSGLHCREANVPTSIEGVNRHPTIVSPGNRSNYAGATITLFTVQAEDPDEDALTYSATGLPPGISINGTSGQVSGTVFNGAEVRDYEVTVTVTDDGDEPRGLSASVSFTWRIVAHTEITNTIGMELILIPLSTFEMGDMAGAGSSDERPVHTVTLTRDYYMGKYEVAQGEYVAVVGSNPSYFTGNDRLPVEHLTWYEMVRYANALSVREGYATCYDNDGNVIGGEGNPYACEGYRLPMEAEWEYAARAGTTTQYSFGDAESERGNYGWYYGNTSSRTHPVGEKLPNPWGLYDVHGNVWEWVYDWYGSSYYGGSPTSDPRGPSTGSFRVMRGGSWFFNAYYQRSANRHSYTPTNRNFSIGFRLVRTAK